MHDIQKKPRDGFEIILKFILNSLEKIYQTLLTDLLRLTIEQMNSTTLLDGFKIYNELLYFKK